MTTTEGAAGPTGQTNATGQSGASRPRRQNDIDEEVFRRDLAEVHLLIDFISSLPGRSLNDLKVLDPRWEPTPGKPDDRRPEMDPAETVRRISLIKFPPDPSPKIRAEDAALLLLAKDCLNELTRPARGRSIAYSTMFAAGQGLLGRIGNLISNLNIISNLTRHKAEEQASSRLDLAERASPEVIPHVRRFKLVFSILLTSVFIWLLLTALTYWDVALGGSILQRVDQLEREKLTILQANPNLYGCANQEGNASNTNASTTVSCLRLETITHDLIRSSEDLSKFSQCRGVERFLFIRCWPGSNFVGRDVGAVRPTAQQANSGARVASATQAPVANHDASREVVPTDNPSSSAPAPRAPSAEQPARGSKPAISGQSSSGGGNQPQSTGERAGGQNTTATSERGALAADEQASRTDGQTIASVISVFSTLILPMMFGLLGTLVATIRSIHDKIRDSLLAPRDLVLTLTGLPIGAIAGLVVGLFINPSGSVPGSSGLTGGLSLSAGGLAFLAGYAADAFFSFLDSIRSQVFAATNPPPGSGASSPRPMAGQTSAPPPR